MKKIAFFLDDVTRFAFYARVSGIHERLRTCNRDIAVYMFRSRARQDLDPEYVIGEYNIYNLPDLEDFDGIILDLYNIYQTKEYWHGAEAARQLMERVKASKKPAISIGNQLEDFYYVGIDNYADMRKLFSHLYDHHHCRKFWLFMGPRVNPENQLRVQAIQDFLMEREGHDHQDYVYYENFESETGRHGFSLFLERFGELPDAIVCANDRIAIGVIEEAEKAGYHAPDDFLLTGFDNLDASVYVTPRLTTVDQNWPEPGRLCIDLLCDIWDGKEVEKVTYVNTFQIYQDSCGCHPYHAQDINRALNKRLFTEMNMEIFDAQLDVLEYGLLGCENLHEVGEVFVKSFDFLNCKSLYLVLCENYENYNMEDIYTSGQSPDRNHDREKNFLINGYPGEMQIAFACEGGRVTMEKTVIQGLFPAFEPGEQDDYLFMPIHFRKYTAGYLVIRDSAYVLENPLIMRAINALTIAVENLYTKAKLGRINQALSRISAIDAMTGFYNRLGFQQAAVRRFEERRKEGRDLTIIFIDMDQLKLMNDRYGHECGDYAILAITGAIRENCGEDSVAVRMGGDEFLLMMDETDEIRINRFLDGIRKTIPQMKEVGKLPYSPSISAGYVITDMSLNKNLDAYIREADEIMYEIKRKKKKGK